MSEQETTTEAPPAEGWSGSHEFTVNVNFAMAAEHGAPCYVVKHNGRYLRIPSAGRLIFVPDKRFATRIDSRLWAMTLAGQLQGGKIVRLVTKEEREWRETAKSGGNGASGS